MNQPIADNYLKGFVRASRIMVYKLDLATSVIMTTLVDKHNSYLMDRNKFVGRKDNSFIMTINELRLKTSLRTVVINRSINRLKESGLININESDGRFTINEVAVSRFDSDNIKEYKKWVRKLQLSDIQREKQITK